MQALLALLFLLIPIASSTLIAVETNIDIENLIAKALSLELYKDPQWIRLLHYNKTLFQGYESEADAKEFFFSSDGKSDPRSELTETIKSFVKTENQCAFPARFLFFKRRIEGFAKAFPAASCEKYQEYLKRVSPKSVSLVFSAYYINNPSSAFGHTLLRFNRNDVNDQGRHELMDVGINYAANPTTRNSFLYAVMGMAGFFKGTFTAIPYYYKVREYNDYEVRDLWSYDLVLEEPELEMLSAHIWEMGSNFYYYYFFTENCSYHMLTLLDAAAPRLNLADRLPYWVIPADTVRIVSETPGLVSNVTFRASSMTQFLKRYEALNSDEKSKLGTLVKEKQDVEDTLKLIQNDESKVRVLDAAIDYMDFKYSSDLLIEQSPTKTEKLRYLSARARIPIRTTELLHEMPQDEKPHLGHDSARIGTGFGYSTRFSEYMNFSMRFALHDVLDLGLGYPKNSQIEFMNIKTRLYFQNNKLSLEEAAVIRIMAVNPLSFYNNAYSWHVETGMREVTDLNCNACQSGYVEFGGGYAYRLQENSKTRFYTMIDTEFAVSPAFFRSNARIGAGPKVGLISDISKKIRLGIDYKYHYLAFSAFNHTFLASADLRIALSQRFAIDMMATQDKLNTDGKLSLYYYF